MKRFAGMWLRAMLPVLVLAVAGPPTPAFAQDEYVIGPEDVLSVSVWLHPELERTVTVGAQGTITFPPVGEIEASGLTVRQLSARLGDRLSTYLRQTTTVTVTITQYMSNSVFVAGAVARPGRYGFERIPSLLEVLNQAGGATPSADLGRIQIVRRDGPARRILTADLDRALLQGSFEGLPTLQAGDVITVPLSAAAVGKFSPDAVGVLGEVQHPGLYPVGDGQDLWMALSLAGGPTARSNLSAIRVLTKDQDRNTAVTVNLQETLTRGNRSPYVVRPGDIVFVSAKGANPWTVFTAMLSVARDVVFLNEILKNNNNN